MVYPLRCPICDSIHPVGGEGICEKCEVTLPWIDGQLCLHCGKPVPAHQMYCKDCLDKPSYFDAGRGIFLYSGQMQQSIARFKYGGRQEYARVFGRLIWEKESDFITSLGAQALFPVPVHPTKKRERGYNQAELLANALSHYCKIKVFGDCLVRVRKTIPQKQLSSRQRARNLQDAFSLSETGEKLCETLKCAIIIDDIYTTGKTMEECAKVLRQAGVTKVYFLCVCLGSDR